MLFLRAMGKGETTRETIVAEALSQAVDIGLENISLGVLASSLDLSKSGLFAHFKSKEALQIAVLEEAIARFTREVAAPAMGEPEGEARIAALFRNFLAWIKGDEEVRGCLFVAASQEYDARPGAVRDLLVKAQKQWRALLARVASDAVRAGHFRADLDPQQFAFEFYGIALAYQQTLKLLEDRTAQRRALGAFEDLLDKARA